MFPLLTIQVALGALLEHQKHKQAGHIPIKMEHLVLTVFNQCQELKVIVAVQQPIGLLLMV